MKKLGNFIKGLGFTFSFKRLRKAIILVILFALIGFGVYGFYELESTEGALKKVYVQDIALKYDLGGRKVISVYKKDINSDKKGEYIFIAGTPVIGNDKQKSSNVEKYSDMVFVVIDGLTNQVKAYDLKTTYKADVTLKICDDEKGTYFLISDTNGAISLFKLKDDLVLDLNEDIVTEMISKTVSNEFLGYTIYSKRSEDNENIVEVTLDNYGKNYLGEYKKVTKLDYDELGLDVSKYRETYLRDKYSSYALEDTNSDGVFELAAYQYVLYNLEENSGTSKTLGVVKTIYTLGNTKVKFSSVEVSAM